MQWTKLAAHAVRLKHCQKLTLIIHFSLGQFYLYDQLYHWSRFSPVTRALTNSDISHLTKYKIRLYIHYMQYYHNMTIAYNAYIYFPLTIVETVNWLFSGIVKSTTRQQFVVWMHHSKVTWIGIAVNPFHYQECSGHRYQLTPEVKIYPKQNIIKRWGEPLRCNKTPQI